MEQDEQAPASGDSNQHGVVVGGSCQKVCDYTEDELIELYEERAAIFEFDGGLSREDAEYRAGVEIANQLKPRVLPERIKQESRRSNKKGK